MNQPADEGFSLRARLCETTLARRPRATVAPGTGADLKDADAALSPNRRSAKMESGARVRLDGRRSELPGW